MSQRTTIIADHSSHLQTQEARSKKSPVLLSRRTIARWSSGCVPSNTIKTRTNSACLTLSQQVKEKSRRGLHNHSLQIWRSRQAEHRQSKALWLHKKISRPESASLILTMKSKKKRKPTFLVQRNSRVRRRNIIDYSTNRWTFWRIDMECVSTTDLPFLTHLTWKTSHLITFQLSGMSSSVSRRNRKRTKPSPNLSGKDWNN